MGVVVQSRGCVWTEVSIHTRGQVFVDKVVVLSYILDVRVDFAKDRDS